MIILQQHFRRGVLCIGCFVSLTVPGFAQNNSGSSFYGQNSARAGLCPARRDALSEKDVNNLVTDILWKSYHIKNSYIILNCTEVANCQAAVFEGKPYILYNPNFLGKVKKLNFSQAAVPDVSDKDWETLTILAHELGHHLNGHLTNPKPDARQWDQELEADETAGFIIHLMGGTLSQAQMAFRDVPGEGDYTHPGRQKRLDAVAKGWNDAGPVIPIVPAPKNEVNTITDFDGNVYKTVKVGKQVWMQSNLNVSRFRDGTVIPEAKTEEEWEAAGKKRKPAWCFYNFDPVNGIKYGKLYNWYAVSDSHGLAPEGWHIPDIPDWSVLSDLFGGDNSAGPKLKSTGNWDNKASNESFFSALPGGAIPMAGPYNEIGKAGYWWSSSVSDVRNAWFRYLNPDTDEFKKDSYDKSRGLSVRCIKD